MEPQPIQVVIGVCTCKRPIMLRACLDSLGAQILPVNVAVHIVVVDNEPAPNNQAGVEAFAATCPFPVHYVHEPVRGIAKARNGILDKATELGADWIVMLDDDETADAGWFAALMAQEYMDTPILIGRVDRVMPNPIPMWAPPERYPLKEGAPPRALRTGNVRFSAALIRAGLRFDESLGLRGGEDQIFFREAIRRGFLAKQTDRAIVREGPHPSRMTYRHLMFRHYAHHASLALRRRQRMGPLIVVVRVPQMIVLAALGVLELLVAPLSYPFDRGRFKWLAVRGGFRLAKVSGEIADALGRNPAYRSEIAGH